MIVPVILSGGAGTRLWPLSRLREPKQLLPLVTDQSLLQDTVRRLDGLSVATSAPLIVCNEAQGDPIREQLREIGCEGGRLIYEPEGRNTAPAAAVAALISQQLYPEDDPILLILPADHAIRFPEAFSDAAVLALGAAEKGYLVTFGVTPKRAVTEYGYIRRGAPLDGLYLVEEFVEKPDLRLAEQYVDAGTYYWNSGMFMFRATTYLSEIEKTAPAIPAACRAAVAEARQDSDSVELGSEAFLACPKDSIDYAVMEHTAMAAMVPLDAVWSDVGSWASLREASEQDRDGNAAVGNTLTLDCERSYVRAGDRLVVTIGLADVAVVDTPDAVLVAPIDQDMKGIVARLRDDGRADFVGSAKTRYPWGRREILHAGKEFQTDWLSVRVGGAMDGETGKNRIERWFVIQGAARFSLDGSIMPLPSGESVTIPAGQAYSLENATDVPLELISISALASEDSGGTDEQHP